MTTRSIEAHPSRRFILRSLGMAAVGASGVVLASCTSSSNGDGSTDGSADGSGSNGTSAGTDGSSDDAGDSGDGSSATGDDGSTTADLPEGCGSADEWASGGTASMTAKDCYPDPFATGAAASCALICSTTEGPCTADTLDREDVSEGWGGLPVRLMLKFVEGDGCTPLVGAEVDIWHTQVTGVYSGVTPSGSFCYGDDPDAENYLYFRGRQTTDDDGRVNFDTCYPGWYSGRAIHIHFRVVIGGTEYLISQLFFDDDLNTEIATEHPEYLSRGLPDTTNETDNIIGGESDKSPYILDIQRMPDGVMLASKMVTVRSSTSTANCTAEGASGGGGMP